MVRWLRSKITDPEKLVRKITVGTLTFMVLCGLVLVVAQVKPFWVDEWRVIYNLKFKTPAELWGPLDFMQQFPRVYLQIVKAFSSQYDYSYFTLRLPAYIFGVITILLSYQVMNRLYSREHVNKFLFVMILVSCSTFTEYFVQIKQYTMDLLLSIVALWQLLEILQVKEGGKSVGKYLLLCATFLAVPYFSYSYPIALAPVYGVVALQSLQLLRNKRKDTFKVLAKQWLPLMLGLVSIGIFYVLDVKQVMADKGMHQFWGHLMMAKGWSWESFFVNFYMLFAEVGAGLVFWLLFGILGIAAFTLGLYACGVAVLKGKYDESAWVRMYATSVLVLVIALFVAGKFPLGEPRLNAFTIPSIAILIIYLLDRMKGVGIGRKASAVLATGLYVGVIGNIYTTFFASVTGAEYARKLNIYKTTENAIVEAQAKKLPIMITPDVAYPYDKTRNLPFWNTVPGDWVLKTFPAFKVDSNTLVIGIRDMSKLSEAMKQLPPTITEVMAGDGTSFRIIRRGS